MRIENHRLIGTSSELRVEYAHDEARRPLVPEIAVIHYAVTRNNASTLATLTSRDYLSAHVAIDHTGLVTQMVPFDRVAYHCGESSYRGRPRCNEFSLGLEISHPGPLLKYKDGGYRDVYGKPWTGGVVDAHHRNDAAKVGYRYWAEYPQMLLDLTAHICELWRQEYGIRDIVGHDEIAPRRKIDPGPAFPLNWLRQAVFPSRSEMPTLTE